MIQNIRQTVQRLWQQLTWTQRISFIGLSLAVVGALAFVLQWASAPSYSVLFSGLSNQDASAIITQLSSSKIPYQLDNGGATILVPDSMVDRERIQLAGQNLPAGDSKGWGIFDNTNPWQSDSTTEQVNYTRALEGELAHTIEQLNGVEYARVNIVLPQQDLFSQNQTNPTASVLIKLMAGATLGGDQVAAVQHLVASGVPALKPADVTVVDGSGTILSSNSVLGGAATSGLTVLAAEQRYAGNLEAQLTALLDTALGPDKAIVRVADNMDFTQSDITSNTYDGQGPKTAISEEHVVTNTSLGPAGTVGGVVGLASNVPNYGTSVKGTSGVTQTQGSTDITFAHSNTISHIVQAPGTVTRLSVSVLLDSKKVSDPKVIKSLYNAVYYGAGLVASRGDQLSITAIPFDQTSANAATNAAAAAAQQQFILSLVRWAALIVMPLILLFLLRRLLVPARAEDDEDEDDLPTIEEVENETALLVSPVGKLTIEEQQRNLLHKSMAELAREKPEMVAGVIGRWIEEDGG